MAHTRISASMFFKYVACPHWLYFDAFGDPAKKAPQTKFTEMLLQGGVLHEQHMIETLHYETPKGETKEERFEETKRLMREGVAWIYHGVLLTDDYSGEPDLLERRDGGAPSSFGSYHYVPVEIKSAERLSDSHKYQLYCYGELLEAVQGTRPVEGYILNGSGTRIGFTLAEYDEAFAEAVANIRHLLAGNPPPPHVASSCKQSPWFKECIALAKEKDDIALLYNVKKRVIEALREHGVNTVHDAALIDVNRLAKKDKLFKPSLLERIVMQANALIEGKHYVRRPIDIREAACEIFFDIEGDPLRQVEYLFGHLVRRDGDTTGEEFVYQLAERPEDEGKMWEAFLGWIQTLPDDYVVYHYGTYELTRLTHLEKVHGVPAAQMRALNTFRDRLTDLNELVKDAIVFPLYFYSIKDIGKYVGFVREGAIAGGGESVAYYEDWLATGNRQKLEDIILYNKEDVIATRLLKDWLAQERDKHRASVDTE